MGNLWFWRRKDANGEGYISSEKALRQLVADFKHARTVWSNVYSMKNRMGSLDVNLAEVKRMESVLWDEVKRLEKRMREVGVNEDGDVSYDQDVFDATKAFIREKKLS